MMDDASGIDREDQEPEGAASSLDDDGLFLRLKDWFKTDFEHWEPWREEAREDFAFRAGDQWSDDDKKVLREQLRPVITFNRIDPVIDAVAGTEVSNRQEVNYIPRTEGDVQVNEIYTNAAKWFRDQCDAEDEESDAFQDVLTCGVGWTETRLDYEVDEEGAPIIDRIDPFEMFADSASVKRNFEDARHVFRVRSDLAVDEALALVPNAEPEDLDASWAVSGDDTKDPEYEDDYRPSGDPKTSRSKGKVTLVEVQWWERQSVHLMVDSVTGQLQELDDDTFRVFNKRASEIGMPVDSVTMSKRVYFRGYLGKKLLLKEPSPFQGHFSYKAITGKRDRNKKQYYGLVRQMKDPQRWANKWLSQTLHIMNTNAKGGIIAEDGIAEDMREFERTYARPDAVTRVKAGALSNSFGPKLQPKSQTQLPTGYFNLLEFAISSVRDASGVNLELLGMADRQQAGVLEAQRKKAAMAILATLFDSLRRYRKSQGRLLLQIINEHLSDGRLVRIVGEEGAKYVPLTKTDGAQQFDVIVDDAPSSPHQREQTWAMLMQIIPVVREQMTPDIWAALLPYAPIASSVTEKIQRLIQEGQQGAQQKQAEMAEIAKADAIAGVKETDSKTVLNLAKAGQAVQQVQQPQAQGQPGQPRPGGSNVIPMPAQNDGAAQLQQLIAQVAQGQMATNQMLANLGRAMTAPKRVIRGPDGRPEGMETVF